MGALLQFSRAARMSAGIHPAALHDFWLREMDFATSEGAFASAPPAERPASTPSTPAASWAPSNPEHVLKVYEILAARLDMGICLGCCGAPAYWAGDEARLQATWSRPGRDLGGVWAGPPWSSPAPPAPASSRRSCPRSPGVGLRAAR